jgi:hypothetical protein
MSAASHTQVYICQEFINRGDASLRSSTIPETTHSTHTTSHLMKMFIILPKIGIPLKEHVEKSYFRPMLDGN